MIGILKIKIRNSYLDEYKKFLLEIGYLKKEDPDFKIETENVDEEISKCSRTSISSAYYERKICIKCC